MQLCSTTHVTAVETVKSWLKFDISLHNLQIYSELLSLRKDTYYVRDYLIAWVCMESVSELRMSNNQDQLVKIHLVTLV